MKLIGGSSLDVDMFYRWEEKNISYGREIGIATFTVSFRSIFVTSICGLVIHNETKSMWFWKLLHKATGIFCKWYRKGRSPRQGTGRHSSWQQKIIRLLHPVLRSRSFVGHLLTRATCKTERNSRLRVGKIINTMTFLWCIKQILAKKLLS